MVCVLCRYLMGLLRFVGCVDICCVYCGMCRHWMGLLGFVGCADIGCVYWGLWVVQTLGGFIGAFSVCRVAAGGQGTRSTGDEGQDFGRDNSKAGTTDETADLKQLHLYR